MTIGKLISKKIILFILIMIFVFLGWLKWSFLQDQTTLDPIQKPRWLLFHSTKCEACEKMLELSSKLTEEYQGKVECLNIDIYQQSNEKITSDYKITFIPTSVFEVEGNEPITHIGALTEAELREILNTMVKKNE